MANPFAGCASTPVAALRCGRDCWGAEIDEASHAEECRRLLREMVPRDTKRDAQTGRVALARLAEGMGSRLPHGGL